ncbi:response regulator [Novosphingobium tardum]|uniref:Response regulator n=1 Tax=Novosphingobium tardum TaxID=1538021 RepID=A0ABV8RJM4_9SPHN
MTVPVIIADDHPFILSGVESVLGNSRFKVMATATDGQQALDAIAAHDPAIAILDVRMPVLGGVAVLQALREAGDRRVVVLLTADIEDRQLITALDAGVDGIVFKEGGEDRLIECLETVHAGERYIPGAILAHADKVRRTVDADPFRQLTAREAELVWMLGQGLKNREIAERFDLSEGAIKFAFHAIYRKLGVSTRTELAMMVQRRGFA